MAVFGLGAWVRSFASFGGALAVASAQGQALPALPTLPAMSLADCDAPGIAGTLQPEAQALPEARGIWLDATRLQWPGTAPAAAGEGRARLLWAAGPTLHTEPGGSAGGADLAWVLQPDRTALPAALATRFAHLLPGARWQLPPEAATPEALRSLHRGQLRLVLEDAAGRILAATRLQAAGALDALYASAATASPPVAAAPTAARAGAPDLAAALGATPTLRTPFATRFALWAPTARQVAVCLHAGPQAAAQAVQPLALQAGSGVWQLTAPGDHRGRNYRYLVDVYVPGHGLLRQRVTDPYALSLSADSQLGWIGRLDDPQLAPRGWASAPRGRPLAANTEMAVYELHVRDFSRDDAGVPAAQRGKYAAFAHPGSTGMRHLRALARAGLTDVHLLPVFDLATVPEQGCVTPAVPEAPPDSLAQQAAVMATAARDCFNWGYDPLHFNAPEGSYASSAGDGAVRIREFRQMVMALHAAGLRVGMDVVYNHLSASGQQPHSVLDRIVPGYYHRLDAKGVVERSTCCDNSATEHAMMGRLMRDSVRLWARHHRIDSFRFDLMGHQPREQMLALQAELRAELGRDIQLLGEGWNFGEVADGARFVQAAQGRLAGTAIATFSDRARDALRGGGVGDAGEAVIGRQGWLNGLGTAPNAVSARQGAEAQRRELLAAADLLRLGLAGTLAGYRFTGHDGVRRSGAEMLYAGRPGAGYAAQPDEVVNYVENHDNATLWDSNAFKLPLATASAERARVQVLGLAITAISQGVPYFHAGVDLLRSKSLDGNSFDSGDWFNRLDWSGQTHHFGSGLPPAADNAALHALMAPRLADAALKAQPADIALARQALRDWLAIRRSSTLFRLRTADAVQQRLVFHDTGPAQNPALVVAELDGRGLAGAGWRRLMLLLNTHPEAQAIQLPGAAGQRWQLHPVLAAPGAADARLRRQATVDAARGRFEVPGRSAVVWVQR
ncbi:alpha-1,6-glucosidase domain-containing protein [Aquabacterium sp. OR-4]|uniref:alpha-1,6-glucosidase domain-containing protein n=1 Tax=Aquabacterium sp. OR-4 TaxID=2978127 RepID=UPI0028C7E1C7|nr:alpha-1,6-glucosidase domain-containing protein [Aquabacterium sp. OR-4]MDT7834227.1 alpha-1,6-glucosidase domain-containing protein [Aquabacterium sp. OR-4]